MIELNLTVKANISMLQVVSIDEQIIIGSHAVDSGLLGVLYVTSFVCCMLSEQRVCKRKFSRSCSQSDFYSQYMDSPRWHTQLVWHSRPFTFLYLGAGEGKGLMTHPFSTCARTHYYVTLHHCEY